MRTCNGGDGHAEEGRCQREQAVEHGWERQVWLRLLLADGEASLTLLLGPVAHVPVLELHRSHVDTCNQREVYQSQACIYAKQTAGTCTLRHGRERTQRLQLNRRRRECLAV